MSQPLAGLDYSRCSRDELRKFLLDRGTTAPDQYAAWQLEWKLRSLDHTWNFNLMGLPAELRNRIYRELLLFNPGVGNRPDNINILRTNKQIYREADGLLYALNTFTVRIHSHSTQPPPLNLLVYTRFQRKTLHHTPQIPGTGPITAEHARLPKDAFLKIRHLRLEIRLHTERIQINTEPDRFAFMNQRLLALASILGGSTALVTVDVRFRDLTTAATPRIPWTNLTTCFYPLTKLAAAPSRAITFHGFLPPIQAHLQNVRASTPGGHPFDAFSILADLRKQTGEIKKSSLAASVVNASFDTFVFALDVLSMEVLLPRFMDRVTDLQFCGKVESLRGMWESHSASWKRCLETDIPRGRQEEIRKKSFVKAMEWLGVQERMFRGLMRSGQ